MTAALTTLARQVCGHGFGAPGTLCDACAEPMIEHARRQALEALMLEYIVTPEHTRRGRMLLGLIMREKRVQAGA